MAAALAARQGAALPLPACCRLLLRDLQESHRCELRRPQQAAAEVPAPVGRQAMAGWAPAPQAPHRFGLQAAMRAACLLGQPSQLVSWAMICESAAGAL